MYNFASYTLKIKWVVAVFHKKKFTHGKGHQMMTFRAGCGPLHVNWGTGSDGCEGIDHAFSQRDEAIVCLWSD